MQIAITESDRAEDKASFDVVLEDEYAKEVAVRGGVGPDKPRQRHGQDMPPSVLGNQRVTLMTRNQGRFQAAGTPFRFYRHGRSGQEMCELFPHLGSCADELCLIRSIHSEPINHDPAVTFMQTGRPQPGLPCTGS